MSNILPNNSPWRIPQQYAKLIGEMKQKLKGVIAIEDIALTKLDVIYRLQQGQKQTILFHRYHGDVGNAGVAYPWVMPPVIEVILDIKPIHGAKQASRRIVQTIGKIAQQSIGQRQQHNSLTRHCSSGKPINGQQHTTYFTSLFIYPQILIDKPSLHSLIITSIASHSSYPSRHMGHARHTIRYRATDGSQVLGK